MNRHEPHDRPPLAPRAAGFTLIELMVVVAIVGLVASFAIPNLIESRMAANEAAAIETLRSFFTAQQIYRDRDLDQNGIHDYADASGKITAGTPGGVGLLHFDTPDPEQDGYEFGVLEPIPPATALEGFRVIAHPLKYGRTGRRTFIVDETGVIRYTFDDITDDGDVPADLSAWTPIGSN
jgi:type IV pilus assembly protein PilA